MLDSYRDLIDELLATPTTVRDLVAALPPPAVPVTVPGLVAELRERDRAVYQRLQTMLHQPNAHLRALAAPATAMPAPAAELPALLDALDTARGDLVSLLMNLTLKDWERTATHETEGEITVADEVERHVEFDEDHLARIARAIEA